MPDELEMDVLSEALELAAALRAHVELLAISGTVGLPRSAGPIAQSLSEPPPSLAPGRPDSPGVRPEPVHQQAPRLEPHRAAAPSVSRPVSAPQPQGDVPDWLAAVTGQGTVANSPPQTTRKSASEVAAEAPPVARVLPSSPEERQQRLVQLEESIRGCTKCGLCKQRTQTVFSRGTGSSGLCFVGEGPGADEDQQGYPFVGAAGQLLDKMIGAMGLLRDEVYVCNIVKCRPPENRKPEPTEMRTCMPYLEEQLELLAPEVIVALGATALEGLLGVSGGITKLRGTWKLYKGRIAVMPTFHPAYLLRQPSAKHVVWEDMLAVLRQMGRPVPERKPKPQP